MSITFDRSESYSEEDATRHNDEFDRREEAVEGKQQVPKDRKRGEKKYINMIPIPRETYWVLVDLSNKMGIPLHKFCGEMLVEMSRDPARFLQTGNFKVSVLQHQAKIYYEKLEVLELTVAEYLQHQTEGMAENIGKQCDELGVDLDEIMNRVKSGPIRAVLSDFRSDPNTKTAQCRAWLKKYMREHEYRVSARQGNLDGLGLGFHRDMIATVRKQMGIESISGGKGEFLWEWPTPTRASRAILGDDLT